MKSFLLIYKNYKRPIEELGDTSYKVQQYGEWAADLGERHVLANRLHSEGAHLKTPDDVWTDGPFLEAKEMIAGFTVIQAASLEDAIEDAKRCPLNEYLEVMVRPMVESE